MGENDLKHQEDAKESQLTGTAVVASLSVVLTVAILVIVYLLVRAPSAAPIEIHPPAPTLTPAPTVPPSPLIVYVTGAVNQPGVVQVPPNSRAQDAVAAAGGLARDADAGRVNLAAALSDGQHLHVPAVGEVSSPADNSGSGAIQGTPININTAGVAELMILPGVGEVMAASIVNYRDEHGPFSSIEAIMEVPGIGEGKFEGFREMITVGP